ncbi:MAG: preprotein translocase subunit SecG [Desulfobulbales bacterium]|nr:preprotein translocase subunit SecG [Desulfobulbales bacterium]
MVTIITFVHILVCFFLVIIVLLQHGKGANVGATFGGAGNTVFGTEGPVPMLNKVTTGIAIIFMLTSITLAYFSANSRTGSVMDIGRPAVEATNSAEVPLETGPVKVPLPADETGGSEQQAPGEFPGQRQ